MKQAIKKVALEKASPAQPTPESKTLNTSKTEKERLADLNKTNLFNRFLESSCDCV